ncbi:2-oxo-tetronate isomerase [Marinimicrococcus flavescens]|uniref:Hydroxypyruvate isomerase family protein n=1 Tax=Marinimicrococcus flavescens TaxID=3031815 RepID=A0AAP3XSP0_9PROT|nr:hydroxypyruvate isomerase family protein [Marinimicrococcus flavescens]
MPKFAANLSMMFQEVPFLDRFGAAAQAGFSGVEFLFPYEHPAGEIAARLDEHGLTQALFNLPPGDFSKGERGIASLPGREAEFEKAVETALAYARALRCRTLHCMAGLLPDEAERGAREKLYVANLRKAARACAAEGVTLLVEPINTRDIPGYFLNYQAQGRRIIEAVGEANLKLQLDLYHCQVMEGDLARHIEAFLDIAAHIQIAGVPERHEPDVGEINYPYLFELLDRLGYQGWIGCEYRPRGRTEDGLGWFAPWRRKA